MPKLSEPEREGDGPKQHVLNFTAFMMELLNRVHQVADDGDTFWEDRKRLLESDLTRLRQHWSELPPLPRSGLPAATLSAVAQHHVDVQLVLMILYCQILRTISRKTTISRRLQILRKSAAQTYYRDLLGSLRSTIDIFDYAYKLDARGTASSWPRCFGLFCAVLMLGIAKLRQDGDVDTDKERLETGLKIFRDLADTAGISGLAQSAAELLSGVLQGIEQLGQKASGAIGAASAPSAPVEGADTDIANVSPPSAPRLSPPARGERSGAPSLKRSKKSSLAEVPRRRKRARTGAGPVAFDLPQQTPTWAVGQDHSYPPAMSFDGAKSTPPQEPSASQGFETQPFPPSAASSFTEQAGYFEAELLPSHPDNMEEYHPGHHWVHPPMVYAPPLYDDWWQYQFQSGGNAALDGNLQPMSYNIHPPLALPPSTWTLENPSNYNGQVFGRDQQAEGLARRQSMPQLRILSPASDQHQQNRSLPPSRRPSQVEIETMAAKAAHNPAETPSSQSHYYEGTMTNEGLIEYHQTHIQSANLVTTGPYTGDGHGQHWGWA
ncbi:hypothetical protein CLCR_07003 [Cladophialophora carrionii]|uniref:Uncharacterized protein n=1 Tax=Cladophialophora carrionii TaxID=86049 RepID=A0A1C1CM76_9EURO|nr:hypothetical protein CLCR_07003 [Cladophialophora carrionii]